jgi:hypothetical protein
MVAITFQPLAANNFAVALPIPADAPVIKMVFVIFARLIFSRDKAHSPTLAACSETGEYCSQNGMAISIRLVELFRIGYIINAI